MGSSRLPTLLWSQTLRLQWMLASQMLLALMLPQRWRGSAQKSSEVRGAMCFWWEVGGQPSSAQSCIGRKAVGRIVVSSPCAWLPEFPTAEEVAAGDTAPLAEDGGTGEGAVGVAESAPAEQAPEEVCCATKTDSSVLLWEKYRRAHNDLFIT
eukprot:5416702-Amphidinium_carterae.1